jgi:GntR family transcriptional regulator/MocR family aminotransferase
VARTTTAFALHLTLPDGPARLAQRLSAALVGALAAAQLADGDTVPSTRVLAHHLQIARSVVVESYEELTAAGFFVARPGSATRVGPGAVAAARAGAFSSALAPPSPPGPPADHVDSVRFNLLPGFPDTSLINTREWKRAWRCAADTELAASTRPAAPVTLSPHGADHPQPGSVTRLRMQLADHLRAHRGMVVDPDDVFIYPGVNAAIRSLNRAVSKPGHTLAFEDPGYPAGRRAFIAGGAEVRPVPVDDQGLLVDRLSDRDYGVYLTPAHQYPLGSRLSVMRRTAVLDWATENSAIIFEDDYDGEFRYDVAPMPALRAMSAGADRVVYLGTTSKILTRDLRIAWAIVPGWLRQTIRRSQAEEGEMVNTVATAALDALMQSGALRRHIAGSHRTYAARRDRFTEACRRLLPGATVHGIDAGLHVVLTLWPGMDDVAATLALRTAGVACAPLSQYFDAGHGTPTHGLVCGYSRLPESRAADAVAVIRDVLGNGRVSGEPRVAACS